jgi:hypothetical protein
MSEERMAIIRGVLNSIRIFNKMWKIKDTEINLLISFGREENITLQEATEFLSIEKAA